MASGSYPAGRRPGRGLGASKHAIDCEPRATARCIARSGARVSPRSRSARSNGASAARRCGCFLPQRRRRGSARHLRGLAARPARGTIQPLAYARGLAGAAIAAGAAVHTRSPVRSAERTGKAWTLVTDGGTVAADWIAVATDAYGGAPWPQGRREQVRLPYFNFATAAAERRAAGLDPAWPRGLLGHADYS